MLVHRRVTPSIKFTNPIFTPGWKEALRELSIFAVNTTQYPRPGLQPRLLDPKSSALTQCQVHTSMLVLFKSLILVHCKRLGEIRLGKLQIGIEIGGRDWPLDL